MAWHLAIWFILNLALCQFCSAAEDTTVVADSVLFSITTGGVSTLSNYFGVVVTTAVAAVGSVASRQFKSKQPKKKKVLSKKKKSSYRLAEAKSALDLSPSARFQTVVAATLRPSPPPSQSSPTKEEVKVERDRLARSVSSLTNRLEQNRSKLEESHVTKWKMLKKKDRQLVREKKKLKNISNISAQVRRMFQLLRSSNPTQM